MISSGFFLLPGLAASHTGRGIVLAYLLAGLLIVPALLSQAELATAMPRAGGPYYYLDRTLGPLVGTVRGVSTWLTLVLKSAFALIGMGAYVGLAIDVPIPRGGTVLHDGDRLTIIGEPHGLRKLALRFGPPAR